MRQSFTEIALTPFGQGLQSRHPVIDLQALHHPRMHDFSGMFMLNVRTIANILTAIEFSPIFLSGSTQVHGRSLPSLQHFHNPKTEQAFDFLPFPIFPALPASLSENSLHHWPFSVVHTFFGVTLPPRGLRGMLATFPPWAHYAD